jgi:transposase InsO family protein
VTDKVASVYLAALRARPESTAEDFAPRRARSGRKARVWLEDAEVLAARAALLATNRTETAGSTPEALRLAAARGELRPEVASLVQSRVAAGQAPLPPAAMAQLRISETVTRAYRAPRNAWLDYVSSPGSLQVTVDEETGAERLVQPGERWTLDDGSINLLCIVPGLERCGDACWDRWGVAVGRFQLLVTVDHRTRMIVGWSYAARPRDSYRAEDIVATLHPAVMQHGAPREIVLEHGVSAAGLVSDTLGALGVRILRASSPHQKVVESVFNVLWTRLSTLPGQVGRFRGEEEECNRTLTRIRSGALDPRGILIELPALLAAIRDAVALHNAATCNSERCGRWVPADLWSRESGKWLRRVAAEDSWMFAPHRSSPIKVRGANVETSWQPMPGWTVKLVFGAEWLLEFHGVRVCLRYNAHAPECEAVAILAEDCGTRKAGTVLGRLVQIDRIARMTRRALGYGLDPDIGLAQTRSNAQALRRHVAAVRPDGKPGLQTHEIRTGAGDAHVVEMGRPEQSSIEPKSECSTRLRDGQAPTGDAEVLHPRASRATPGVMAQASQDPRLAEFLEDDFHPEPVTHE